MADIYLNFLNPLFVNLILSNSDRILIVRLDLVNKLITNFDYIDWYNKFLTG